MDSEEQSLTREAKPNVYLLSANFNQDQSCFCCGTTAGFRVFTVSPLSEVHRREGQTPALKNCSVPIIGMLFRTNIFAMVCVCEDNYTSGDKLKVRVYDDAKKRFIGELRSKHEVKGLALRRDIICMVCEYAIYVYTCDKLRIILHLTTKGNPRGLCALASTSNPWILCCPGQSTGTVRVQVGQDDRATHVIAAHQTSLAAMAVNSSGTMVATASEKGTVCKVFNTSDGQILFRLRRSTRPAVISCLQFSPDDRFLAVASSSSTVHVFKLDPTSAREGTEEATPQASPNLGPADDPTVEPEVERRPSGLGRVGESSAMLEQISSAVQKAAETVKGVMPLYFHDLGSYAHFRIPDVDANGHPMVDVRGTQAKMMGPQLAFHSTEPRLFILHYSGMLYECTFKSDHDPSMGSQDCSFVGASTWFAVRPDFKVHDPTAKAETVAGGAASDDEDAEDWELIP